MKFRSLLGIIFAFAALSCSDPGSTDTSDRTLESVSGNAQSIGLSTPSAPLVVRVVSLGGDPIAGEEVEFSLELGAGDLTVHLDTTDADGLASTTFSGSAVGGPRRIGAHMQIVGTGAVIFDLDVGRGVASKLLVSSGDEQGANAGALLGAPLGARVTDGFGDGVAGAWVKWDVESGSGTLSADSSLTNASGVASVNRTLGAGAGGQVVRATLPGVADTARFHATAKKSIAVLAGGNNVPSQCTSDLWVAGTYAYTGTWGNCFGQGAKVLHVWNVASGVTKDTTITVAAGGGTVSDNEVSEDGSLLLATFEGGGAANGLYLYSLANPARPALLSFEPVSTGLHTGTFGVVGGKRYVFASKDPSSPAVMTFRVQVDSADKLVPVSTVPVAATYGAHDQFFRDGYLFASVWNAGLMIFDVGAGTSGGSPSAPVLVSTIVTTSMGLTCNCVHNAWWYHDSAGGKRYVFVGQEGPGSVGTSSSGSIHVIDVSSLSAPEEVATFTLGTVNGQATGVHNFWMDEERGILYAAYYNGGVVALDVTGTLSGNLATREIARLQPGGAGDTYVWGVMLANGALWASDMVSGLWKLSIP